MGKEINPVENIRLSTLALIERSFVVLLTNLIPLYGVWHYGWNSFTLILLFIAEGVIVLFTDVIKRFFGVQKRFRGVLFFEFVFIFFFGFFAILIFGRDADSSDLVETMRSAFHSAKVLPLWPVVSVFIMRIIRMSQDLLAAGALGGRGRQTLYYSGGGWMFLLFFLVMTAPFIADKGPNPMSGLIAIIVLKSLGEIFAVWAPRIAAKGK